MKKWLFDNRQNFGYFIIAIYLLLIFSIVIFSAIDFVDYMAYPIVLLVLFLPLSITIKNIEIHFYENEKFYSDKYDEKNIKRIRLLKLRKVYWANFWKL